MAKNDGSQVKHLTGSERVSVERHAGPLQDVGDSGQLVRVPADLLDVVEGTEEITGDETAAAVYNRGLGHGRAAGKALREKDEDSKEDDSNRDGDSSDNGNAEPGEGGAAGTTASPAVEDDGA